MRFVVEWYMYGHKFKSKNAAYFGNNDAAKKAATGYCQEVTMGTAGPLMWCRGTICKDSGWYVVKLDEPEYNEYGEVAP